MKYFRLKNSILRKEVGFMFQTNGFIDEESAHGPNSRINMEYDKFPKFVPDLRFQLHEKSKLTDIVNASNINAIGFLMNTRTRDIFEQCNLPEHKFYRSSILDHDEISHLYYWMHIISNDYRMVDFSQSIFRISKLLHPQNLDDLTSVQISSLYDFKQVEKKISLQYEFIIIDTLYVNDQNHYDMIHFGNIDINTVFISEKLANLLKKEKITGITITPTDKLVNLADE